MTTALVPGSFRKVLTVLLFGTGQEFVFQVAATVVWLRCWGVQTYSEWIMLSLIPNFLARGNTGVFHVATTDMLRFRTMDDGAQLSHTFTTLQRSQSFMTALVIIAWLACCAWIVFGGLFVEFQSLDVLVTAAFFSFQFMLFQRQQTLLTIPKSHGDAARAFKEQNRFRLVHIVVFLLLPFVTGPIVCLAICLIIQTLVYYHTARRVNAHAVAKHSVLASASRAEAVAMLRRGLIFSAFSFGQILLSMGSVWYLGTVLGPQTGAAFNAMRNLTRIPVLITKSIEQGMRFDLTSHLGRGDMAHARFTFFKGLALTGVGTLVVGLGLLFGGPTVFAIWTDSKLNFDAWTFALLVGAAVAFSLSSYCLVVPFALNRFSRLSAWFTGSVILMILVAFILRPHDMQLLAATLLVGEIFFLFPATLTAFNMLVKKSRT